MRPEYTEEPCVTNDADYYAALTRDEVLDVRMMPGKGKGVILMSDVADQDLVITERALVCAQNLDQMQEGVKCCAATLVSLETPRENLRRVAPALQAETLPVEDKFKTPETVACANAAKGCPTLFCSAAKRDEAYARFHKVLCKGLMSEAQRAAYKDFAECDWIQGGVDYSDTFHLALHVMAIMFSGLHRNETLEEATKPFAFLISCPWERFTFDYLLTGNDVDDDSTTKEETLSKAMRLMRGVFNVGEDNELLTEHRLTRLLGAILLNGQERTPTSPWGLYVSWLSKNAPRSEYKSMKAFSRTNPDLSTSVKGQGIYRVCSCFNHSCVPNIQVSYGDDNDETLLVYALRDIKKGEELCISYIDEDADFKTRQEQLKDHYLFTCACPKCTEDAAR
ncbi:Histone-lysine N-methyltransferase ATXR2 [Diplonema papillatum]|nr:Histone-lysine N-methyltransferase ATXR2 [Diplonema papillatum]